MRAVQVTNPGDPFELVERPVPEPGRYEVRIRVQACGICHSDSLTKLGHWPGIQYPRVPGHEIVGIVDAVGEEAKPWTVGQRVGVGWFGGCCFHCDPCRRGDFIHCASGRIPGITMDGGYAEYMVAPSIAVASVPDDLDPAEAAPLLCAGITTFNALRHSVARAGDRVAILGIGGLGHLGVQFAAKMGFETIAIARGADKAEPAKKLGAHHYIDSTTQNVAEALKALGGAKVVAATVTNADAMGAAIDGLALGGELIVLGATPEKIPVNPFQLIGGSRGLRGWPSGIATDSEDTLRFAALQGVRTQIERYPLERAEEAYDRMMSGKARFRVVLETGV
jgi:D-arabinose 1-dehydrogenase-like Zn-dependent alcohol dehydrogenase